MVYFIRIHRFLRWICNDSIHVPKKYRQTQTCLSPGNVCSTLLHKSPRLQLYPYFRTRRQPTCRRPLARRLQHLESSRSLAYNHVGLRLLVQLLPNFQSDQKYLRWQNDEGFIFWTSRCHVPLLHRRIHGVLQLLETGY